MGSINFSNFQLLAIKQVHLLSDLPYCKFANKIIRIKLKEKEEEEKADSSASRLPISAVFPVGGSSFVPSRQRGSRLQELPPVTQFISTPEKRRGHTSAQLPDYSVVRILDTW